MTILTWIQTFQNEITAGIIIALQIFSTILFLVMLRQIALLRRELREEAKRMEGNLLAERDKHLEKISEWNEENRVKQKEEEENQIISTVLREIFP